MIVPLLRSLRPHQWIKNLLVAAPLLFSKRLTDLDLLLRGVGAVGLFSLVSGSVYLVNDLFDVEKDRLHPTKCRRPIPSGALPMSVARSAAALLMLAGLGTSLAFGLPFFACAASYLLLNLAYSLELKHIPFVDVLSIAGGFLLRVVAGAFAVQVVPSNWLLICTFVLACYLGFGKRAHELSAAAEGHARVQRPVLARYQRKHLLVLLWLLAAITTMLYVLYTLAPQTQAFFGTQRLRFTAPFAAIGVVRFLLLVGRRESAESPTDAMLRDPLFIANLAAWVVVVVLIIYVL